MGYTTEFSGEFKFSRALTEDEACAIREVSTVRHCDPHSTNDVRFGMPGFYCQWELTEDNTALVWDEGEKFYAYIEWLRYLIQHYFSPFAVQLNGRIIWQGEEIGDVGTIVVQDNAVSTLGTVEPEEPEASKPARPGCAHPRFRVERRNEEDWEAVDVNIIAQDHLDGDRPDLYIAAYLWYSEHPYDANYEYRAVILGTEQIIAL